MKQVQKAPFNLLQIECWEHFTTVVQQQQMSQPFHYRTTHISYRNKYCLQILKKYLLHSPDQTPDNFGVCTESSIQSVTNWMLRIFHTVVQQQLLSQPFHYRTTHISYRNKYQILQKYLLHSPDQTPDSFGVYKIKADIIVSRRKSSKYTAQLHSICYKLNVESISHRRTTTINTTILLSNNTHFIPQQTLSANNTCLIVLTKRHTISAYIKLKQT